MRNTNRGGKAEFNYIKWTFLVGVIALGVGFAGTGSNFIGNVIRSGLINSTAVES
jgi:hypothetical protein